MDEKLCSNRAVTTARTMPDSEWPFLTLFSCVVYCFPGQTPIAWIYRFGRCLVKSKYTLLLNLMVKYICNCHAVFVCVICVFTDACECVTETVDNIDQHNITVANDTLEHKVWIRWPKPASPNGLIVTYEIEVTKVDESHVSMTVGKQVIVSVSQFTVIYVDFSVIIVLTPMRQQSEWHC